MEDIHLDFYPFQQNILFSIHFFLMSPYWILRYEDDLHSDEYAYRYKSLYPHILVYIYPSSEIFRRKKKSDIDSGKSAGSKDSSRVSDVMVVM